MSDRSALIEACLTNPDEDTPRLAFADWLDEYGGPTDRELADRLRRGLPQQSYWRLEPGMDPEHKLLLWASRLCVSEPERAILVRGDYARPPGRPPFECLDCSRLDGIELLPEPAQAELDGVDAREWLCVDCYNYRCDCV